MKVKIVKFQHSYQLEIPKRKHFKDIWFKKVGYYIFH